MQTITKSHGNRSRRFKPLHLLEALAQTLYLWAARQHQRQTLARLDDHALKDIGLSRADASHEIDKPFWMG